MTQNKNEKDPIQILNDFSFFKNRIQQDLNEKTMSKDLCETYHLNDPLKELIFNEKYNKPLYTYLVKRDYTTMLYVSVAFRVEDKNIFVIFIWGESKGGKSEVAQTVGKFAVKKYQEHHPDAQNSLEYAFDDFEVVEKAKKIKPGSVLIRDESPKTHGKKSKITADSLNNLLEMIRVFQISFIIVCPRLLKIAICHYCLKTSGKDVKKRTTRCLLFDPEFDSTLKRPIGFVYIKLHDDEAFRTQYEKDMLSYKRGALDKGGLVEKEGEQDNKKKKQAKEETPREKTILDEIDFTGFKSNENSLMTQIKKKDKKWRNQVRDIKLYIEYKSGSATQEVLANKYQIKRESVSMAINSIKGKIAFLKGQVFEKYLLPKLKSSKKFDRVEHNGKPKEPDFLCYLGKVLFVISAKNIKLRKKSDAPKASAHAAELRYCKLIMKDYDKIYLYEIVYDNKNEVFSLKQIKTFP